MLSDSTDGLFFEKHLPTVKSCFNNPRLRLKIKSLSSIQLSFLCFCPLDFLHSTIVLPGGQSSSIHRQRRCLFPPLCRANLLLFPSFKASLGSGWAAPAPDASHVIH